MGETRIRVLVADESRAQRMMLALQLSRWGYEVLEAATGPEALALAVDADVILSGWVLPGMDGPDLCRAFRALGRDRYGYFVLLTSRTGKEDVAGGLDCGADDFLAKPIGAGELRARLRAGERILGMQAELLAKNRALRGLYDAVDRDLAEARRLQESLVPERVFRFDGVEVSLLMRPSGHVGGDLVGCLRLTPDLVALYAIDVSGHGVAAAMMTARLAGMLSPHAPDRNVALRDGVPLPPEEVAAVLNRMMLREMRVDQYFTMVFAHLRLSTGELRLVQAGHPHPVVMHATGFVSRIGAGGFPVGLVETAEYPAVSLRLAAGDRVVIPSDGITECPCADGDLGEAGMVRMLRGKRGLAGTALHRALLQDLAAEAGGDDLPDDVSAVIVDYRGGSMPRTPASMALSPSLPSR
ncbi:PP2C family protein-serine/threonine phosphatase [Paragemmobacter straminiformis]|uniref:SpoIIE family protein phosphatase n=1 Tax=Paragemmobacter straminiformis TaxID=2045119 RepID=A0A842I889_9RHOB|nr:SpoIIE family protein phosphatase [Gemmobacter straminiformis]MBC2836060.1 SpoIIE family protein phosphatase [Gemmobacter straminiformis]